MKLPRFLTRVGSGVLVTVLLASTLLWGFFEIADEVTAGKTATLDEQILLSLRTADDPTDPIGPPFFEEIMRDATALGGAGVLAFLTIAIGGFLLFEGRKKTALFLVISVTGGILLSLALKEVFDRPRPDLVPHGSIVYTSSFPSGHSIMAATTYLSLAALLARTRKERAIKIYLFTLAVFLTIAVGISRVYLGVHWPTDVVAGWAIGAAWALAIRGLAIRFQKRGKMEGETSLSI